MSLKCLVLRTNFSSEARINRNVWRRKDRSINHTNLYAYRKQCVSSLEKKNIANIKLKLKKLAQIIRINKILKNFLFDIANNILKYSKKLLTIV